MTISPHRGRERETVCQRFDNSVEVGNSTASSFWASFQAMVDHAIEVELARLQAPGRVDDEDPYICLAEAAISLGDVVISPTWAAHSQLGLDLSLAMEAKEDLLKVSPMKGVMRFGKKGKLSPMFICPFKIVWHVGEVTYEFALPQGLVGVHSVFHVSKLKKYHYDRSYIIHWDSVQFDQDLSFEEEPVAILDKKVRKLREKEVASVKVQWKHRPVEEATWETEDDMCSRYPQLFTDLSTFSSFYFIREGTIL
ncbi:uncharacterized protein LOC132619958 [Lycium barbarum]|uniref:uncharacterized protein LOC132619958 n=1 Tax=Lycium barbarum TaxID=112863 RepID=UPI00293F602B|nr:uncharacterized protein LOC132619958 [Lycium barbarum]